MGPIALGQYQIYPMGSNWIMQSHIFRDTAQFRLSGLVCKGLPPS